MTEITSSNFPYTRHSQEATPLDEKSAFDLAQKSYFNPIIVDLPDRRRVPIHFRDPARLTQDLQTHLKAKKHCIADPTLVVIPQVTAQNMVVAVTELYHTGYFAPLNPTEQTHSAR
jgi:hypothetical protein